MEFIYLIRDMPILATCKFEMLIFKGSQVIKYYVMFAFLFVQTVCTGFQTTKKVSFFIG